MYQFNLFLFMKKSTVMLWAIFGALLMGCSDEEIAVSYTHLLILNGARQVGKTWLLHEFVKLEYKKEAYVCLLYTSVE